MVMRVAQSNYFAPAKGKSPLVFSGTGAKGTTAFPFSLNSAAFSSISSCLTAFAGCNA